MKYLKFKGERRRLKLLAGSAMALTFAVVSGCAPKPAPPPPPPPVVVVIPPMPTPPMGAPLDMPVPPIDAAGNRHTVNSGISTAQAVWNLRSAYNVAALNCVEAQYTPILDGYKRFLKVYAKQLNTANKQVDASFHTIQAGRAGTVARESYQTQVYNFFSLPPVDANFCQAAMEVSNELLTIDPSQFEAYSFSGLAKLEAPFKSFFDAYDRYKTDLAAWQSRYGGGLITVRPAPGQQNQFPQPAVQQQPGIQQPAVQQPALPALPAQPVVMLQAQPPG